MMEARRRTEEKDAEIRRLEELLHAERAKTAQLEEQLERQSKARAQEAERVEAEKRRVEQERDKRMEASLALDRANRMLSHEQKQREQWETKCEELNNVLMDLSNQSTRAQDSYEAELQKASAEVQQLRRSIQEVEEQARQRTETEEMSLSGSPMSRRKGTGPEEDAEAPRLEYSGTKQNLDTDEMSSNASNVSRGLSGMLTGRGGGSANIGVASMANKARGALMATGKLLSPFSGRGSPNNPPSCPSSPSNTTTDILQSQSSR